MIFRRHQLHGFMTAVLLTFTFTKTVCDSLIISPTTRDMGQSALALRTSVLRRFTNRTPETVALPESFQQPQKYWAQRLSDPAHVVSKRLFPLTTGNDVVSRNITMVLENLLKDYESSQLPTHGKGRPTIVRTNMLIRSMGPISELDMDYSMDCYFRQYWRDSRLSFLGPIKNLSLSIKMLERIWRPDTYFYNGKNSYVHTITVPNKLLRITQEGDILYSMRLTIKAKCPMELRNFPMDRQSCPLILGSYAYTTQHLVYQWQSGSSVDFVKGMALSQFDLISFLQRNLTFRRRDGITTVLTLSTISLDSRIDLPKVRYATALDWFLLMSFFYCIATLLEFAGVHYFTKVGSGEIPVDEEEWEDAEDAAEELLGCITTDIPDTSRSPSLRSGHRRSSLICPIYNDPLNYGISTSCQQQQAAHHHITCVTRHTQTEHRVPKWQQLLYCLAGDDAYRRQRQREAAHAAAVTGSRGTGDGGLISRHVNSVSYIDKAARILFPASFGLLNLFYWVAYYTYQEEFGWRDPPITPFSH
ncbi:gamma-aminobutyric acid receptor subunit alpha-1 isoform X3 [Cryptotermes secundus]|uniref:gamma-aminobutyric acid receptor subunit alpha-1 isoform X3 n=1 Tax=Cryptotermes secundus TaxID=105785 RepID=UPI000CD7D8B0|nr:gamma-aminobutyric acid receptor subunit alpha-1 isoform X3 [Cryptotermes secundus]